MAEQFRLEHAFGHAAGVDRDHRPAGARRHGVQRLRDQALAGAVLAGDQDVGVRRSDARDHLEHRPHGGRLGEDRRSSVGLQRLVRGLELAPAANGAAELGLRAHDRQQPLVFPRLLHEVAGAAAHRLDGDVDRAPRGHHDHRQRFVAGVNALQQVEAFLAGGGVARVVQVHQDHVVVLELERAQELLRRCGGVDDEAFRLQQQSQRFEDVGLIVGDEDSRLAESVLIDDPAVLQVDHALAERRVLLASA